MAPATLHPRSSGTTDQAAWDGLMAAAQAGHAAAYRRLLTEMRPWLTSYFRRRLPPSLVEDAVQDTLAAIHAKRHTYAPDRPFRPWLAVIAHHKWVDCLRAIARRHREPTLAELAVDDHESAVTSAALLRQLMSLLKPGQAQAILLVKLHGYSIEEAAARTGQSPSLVKINIHRGLGKLAAAIRDNEEDDDDGDDD